MNCQVPGAKISGKHQCTDQACDPCVMCMDHISMDHVTHGPSRSRGEALPQVLLDMGTYMGAYLIGSNKGILELWERIQVE